MRTQIKFDHTETMFGHTYACTLPDAHTPLMILENHDEAWHVNNKRITKPYFWFRAPHIQITQLATTMKNLCDLSYPYELKVWHSDKGLDASLKIKQESDAAAWAWSHTEMWSKWSPAEEKAWITEQKPRKLKVRKDGTVQVRVTVSGIENP